MRRRKIRGDIAPERTAENPAGPDRVGGSGLFPLQETALLPSGTAQMRERAAQAAEVGWYHESRLSSLYGDESFFDI